MGNSESQAANEEDDNLDPFDGIDTIGYRVLGVQPNSPASAAGLVSFLDFLVGAEGKMLLGSGEGLQPGDEYDDVDLPALLNDYKGKEMELLVFNIKSQQARLVKLTPSDTWGGAGLLGVTIRLDNYAGAEDRLVRVLTVEAQSPAAVAGLVPEKDFLLGTTHQTLDSTAQLSSILREHQDEVVELYVYNTDSDMVRVVALMPTLAWGGPGLLGAEVGTGYLHRLPAASRTTEGSSVERKVRYVGGAAPLGTKNAANSARRTLVEVEPQLEMEPATDEEDSDHRGTAPLDMKNAATSAGRTLVEVEPQLEMEPATDEKDIDQPGMAPLGTKNAATSAQLTLVKVESHLEMKPTTDEEDSDHVKEVAIPQRQVPPVSFVENEDKNI